MSAFAWTAAIIVLFAFGDLRAEGPTADPSEKVSSLEWRCGAITSLRTLCEKIRAVVEGTASNVSVPIRAIDDAAPSHTEFGGHASIETDAAGTRITLDFAHHPVHAERIRDLIAGADVILPGELSALTLRNLVVRGPIAIEDLRLERSLSFENFCIETQARSCARLRAPPPGAERFAACVELEPTRRDQTILKIDKSTFERPVNITDMLGCGNVAFIGSTFRTGLFLDVSAPPDAAGPRYGVSGSLLLNNSRVDPELFVWGLGARDIRIQISQLGTLLIVDTRASGTLELRDSTIYSVSTYASSLGSLRMLGAAVDDSVVLSDLRVPAPTGGGTAGIDLYFADNKLNGRLALGIRSFADQAAGTDGYEPEARLRLHNNRVDGATELLLDEGIARTIDLRGSRFNSELLVTQACLAAPTGTQDCLRRCGLTTEDVHSQDVLCATHPDKGMASNARVHVDFTNAAVRSLAWNLPVPLDKAGKQSRQADRYTWVGAGFRYDYWDPKPARACGLTPIVHRRPARQI